MKFLAPGWLWGILILPLFFILVFFDEKRKQVQFEKFAKKKVWSWIVPEWAPSYKIRKTVFLLLSFVFFLIALARPQFGTHEETVQVSGLDIMVVIDVSQSMDAEDVVPSRLKKAKHWIHSVLNHLGGDRVGVVAFAAGAYVACPLTTDLSYVWESIQILNSKTILSQGTDVGVGLEAALKALDRGSEESGGSKVGVAPSRAIILISDGEDHQEGADEVAKKIQESGTRLYLLGVGTEQGGPIPIRDENGNSVGFKREKRGDAIVTRFHADELKRIASAGGGMYFSVSDSEDEVNQVLHDLGTLNRTDYAERKFLVYEERFQIPLAIAIILLFIEMSLPSRRIVMFLALLWAPFSYADFQVQNAPPLDTYLENQKGIQAYQEGKLDDAKKSFGAAQARDPSRPELEYNQGLVQLQQGEVDRSIESFLKSAKGANDRNNKDLLGKSLYNLGAAFSKKGDTRSAIRAYSDSIQSAIEQKNSKLEAQARKNLQLLVEEMKKQKQQQKDQEQKKDQQDQKDQQDKQDKQDKKDQKDQNKDDQNKQDQKGKNKDEKKESGSEKEKKEKESKSNPDQQDKQPNQKNKQEFKSEKMTPEDADRVMSELKNKERELLEKLNKQNARGQSQSKDW